MTKKEIENLKRDGWTIDRETKAGSYLFSKEPQYPYSVTDKNKKSPCRKTKK